MYRNGGVIEDMLRKVEYLLRENKSPFYCLLGILRDGSYNSYGKCKYCEYRNNWTCGYGRGRLDIKIC